MNKNLLFFYIFFSFQFIFVSDEDINVNIESFIKKFLVIENDGEMSRHERIKAKIEVLRNLKKISNTIIFMQESQCSIEGSNFFTDILKELLIFSKKKGDQIFEESVVCSLALEGEYYNRTIDLDDDKVSIYSIINHKNPRKLFVETFSQAISRELQSNVLRLSSKNKIISDPIKLNNKKISQHLC